jgi:hypothetical protein
VLSQRSLGAALAGLLLAAAAVTACAPEPTAPSPQPSETGAVSPTTPAATSTATPVPAAEKIELPASCEDVFSPEMRAALEASDPPLNDPGVTMLATQNAELLEILDSGIPTIRCTWGAPSEKGIATNVSLVDPEQSAAILAALVSAGFGCEEALGGTVCRIEQRTITQDDNQVVLGETHLLRGNAWVSTARINADPQGYTEDIAATLWG